MTLKAYKFNVGDIEYDVLKCEGEGQCQCKRCKDRGVYNVSWTSWFYKLNENDKGVLCSDCLREILIQRRIAEVNEKQKAEIERLTEELAEEKRMYFDMQDTAASRYTENCKLIKQRNELQKQVGALKEQRDVFKRLFESVNTSHFSTDSIIETMNSFYREQAEHLAGLKIEQAVKDIAPLAIQRFINQLDIDEIIRVDSDLGKELLKEKEFVLKRYYGVATVIDRWGSNWPLSECGNLECTISKAHITKLHIENSCCKLEVEMCINEVKR